MDKLGIFHANQTYMCLDPHQNEGWGWYRETSLSIPVIFLLTIPRWYFFCGSFCPPPFRRKAEGHSFRHSVLPSFRPSVRPSVLPSFRPPNIVGTLCAQLLLQFYADSFETLQMF